MTSVPRRRVRPLAAFVLTLLLIELLDEIVFGVREAAWPLIRTDLGLNYIQIGILLSLPTLIGNVIEPALGILGDVWKRRALIVAGGLSFTLALLLVGVSQSFYVLLLAFILFNPSSGAFVSLSQAALMDYQPERHEQNMARWSFAGSLGQAVGPLLLGAVVLIGGGWRSVYIALAGIALALAFIMFRSPLKRAENLAPRPGNFIEGVKKAFQALRRRDVLRWLVLLEFANLMMDILLGYLALYFVDVARVSVSEAGIAVAIWSGIGLLGDALLIPLLERMRGLDYLRVSAVIEFAAFIAFLLVEPLPLKLAALGVLGFFNSGWYSILQGQLYSAMPGQSGTVITLSNITGFAGALIPFTIGLLAERFGLGSAMWFLLLGPVALLIGLPRKTL